MALKKIIILQSDYNLLASYMYNERNKMSEIS